MIKTKEQFHAANQAAVDTLLTLANLSLANAERLSALNLSTARAFFTDSSASIGAVLAAKDPQDLLALQKTLAKPVLEKSAAYSRSVYEMLTETGNDLTEIIEGQAAGLKHNVVAAIEQSLKYAPGGSEPMVAAVKSVLAQADSAYDTMAESARQARTAIEGSVASASAATIDMMSRVA
ncbi:MAG TPA: phasin family protein [Rhodocyclaceae bacterium]|nr:phasin family protein [Rhodocyclaceae bacterium]